MVFARTLGVEGFEAYAFASAAFIVMVTFTPRGFDKFALRVLPPRGDGALLLGYLRFSRRRTLWTALAVGAGVAAWALATDRIGGEARIALLLSCVALPFGAAVHLKLEALTAFGAAVPATLVFRVLVPAVALAAFGLCLAAGAPVGGPTAIACWAVAWAVALAAMTRLLRGRLPDCASQALPAVERPGEWERGARPFWIYRLSMAALGQAGVLMLDLLRAPPGTVGAYAAALASASLVQVLATSTNRIYAGRLSLLLERQDLGQITQLRRQRLRWLALPVALYGLAMLLGARPLLALFRPEFVDEGATALRILAVAMAMAVLLGMGSTLLKFRRRNRAIYTGVAVAACVQLLLLALLVPRLGATGAAIACGISLCGMYAHFAREGQGEMRALRAEAAAAASASE